MQDPTANFYKTQKKFNREFEAKSDAYEQMQQDMLKPDAAIYKSGLMDEEAIPGFDIYNRWAWYMEPRVYPSGNTTLPSQTYTNYKQWLDADPSRMSSGNWIHVGPNSVPTSGGGAGRINFVRINPANTQIIFVGSPSGGVWKSSNGGTTWGILNDFLSVIGVTDLVIDPADANHMYIATGDGEAGDTYSIGVMETIDAGVTWTATGLTWNASQGRTISRLLMNPNNSLIMLAATSNGIYRTVDGGSQWTVVANQAGFKDMEFKPTDPTTVYATTDQFYISTNSGQSFSPVTSGLPSAGNVDRMAIGVTPADPQYVYVLSSGNDDGFYSLCRSTNSATSFTQRSTTPNILGWNANGGDAGGQGWYDLSIAVSTTNKDFILCGGVNIWESSSGGTSWALNAHWTGGGGQPYVHADIHYIEAQPSNTFWVGCDGGVFKTTNNGTAWTDVSHNISAGQMYGIGCSATTATRVISGWQDNGTNLQSGSTWGQVLGGDGMIAFIDWSNNNKMYGSLYYGDLNRTTDGGNNWTGISVNTTENAGWVTPWCQDPNTANTIYAGYENVWKSTNSGTGWTNISSNASMGTSPMKYIAVAKSSSQIIYASKTNKIWRTTNGGTAWVNVTNNLPVSSASITSIAIDPTDGQHVYVTMSGYSNNNKVYTSVNGGNTWINYSTGLPNLPANIICYQTGSNDAVYVGMDVGVYYRDASMSSWIAYNTGLTNAPVVDLEIFYPTSKIRAGTFGRGLWESDLFTPGGNTPVAGFTATPTMGCSPLTVQYTDASVFNPTSWNWSFPGGTPGNSAVQNPTVVYNSSGFYDATLIVTGTSGSDTLTISNFINVLNPTSVVLPLQEGFSGLTFPPSNWLIDNPDGSYTWERAINVGGFGNSTSCTAFDNYTNDLTGTRDGLWTPKYDLTNAINPTLNFDVAYARYSPSYSDTLAVFVSTDCGLTYNQIYLKGGTDLATAPDDTTGIFIPTATQWRTESINLSSYIGSPSLFVIFENRNYYGQKLYLDNINLFQGIAPVSAFSVDDSSFCAPHTAHFSDQSSGAPTSWSWAFQNGNPATSNLQNPSVVYNTAGTWNVSLTVTNSIGNDIQVINNFITVYPAATTPTITQTGNVLTCSVTAAVYVWYFNGNVISGANGQTYNATQTGSYQVIITTSDGCSATSQSTNVVITSISDILTEASFEVFPNPNNGEFSLYFQSAKAQNFTAEITDITGRILLIRNFENISGAFNYNFNLKNFASGTYFLTLKNANSNAVKKLVIY